MMRLLLILFAPFILAACGSDKAPGASDSGKLVLTATHFNAIPGWDADNHSEALTAFLKSCAEFNAQDDTDVAGEGNLIAPVATWKAVCRKAELVPTGNEILAKSFFETAFVPFLASSNGNHAGLITGYYYPTLKGSFTQHRPYVYPVYGLPQPGTPSFTREQIDRGALKGKAIPIAYVDDPVQLFFLHIQGSGEIELDSHETLHVGYAGNNGQPYVAIGKVLVDKGLMKKEEVTMPHLRQWLYDHPGDMWKIMWNNTSYIFFRDAGGSGSIGTEKVPLTANRSLAVDIHYIPLGMPVFLDTILPETPASPMAIQRRLLIAQDSGSAIRGPLRADIFFGAGEAAELLAGRMKEGGTLTLLVPRALALTIEQSH